MLGFDMDKLLRGIASMQEAMGDKIAKAIVEGFEAGAKILADHMSPPQRVDGYDHTGNPYTVTTWEDVKEEQEKRWQSISDPSGEIPTRMSLENE